MQGYNELSHEDVLPTVHENSSLDNNHKRKKENHQSFLTINSC